MTPHLIHSDQCIAKYSGIAAACKAISKLGHNILNVVSQGILVIQN